MKRITLTTLLVAVFCFAVTAGGYQVRLQGQKQNGMALVGAPLSLGASSIFYNPAGLSFMKTKFSISAGASAIMSNIAFQKEGTSDVFRSDNPLSTPFYLFGAGKIGDNITLGLGIYTPYGSSTSWEEENEDGIPWPGKFIIQEISFFSVFIQPTIAYKINDKLSIGAGFIYAYGKVSLNKALNYNDDSKVELEGSTGNIGFNAGIQFRPTEKLSIGVDYRSRIGMEVEDGDATFTVPSMIGGIIPEENKFDAELPLPANLDIGISYQVTEKLLLALEVNWVQWSTYEELSFTFKEKGEMLNSTSKKAYKDSWITRLGGQYTLNDKFDFRLGVYYDPSPVNEDYFNPETVSLNTFAWTAGISYRPVEKLSIDLSFVQLNGLKADRKLLDEQGNNTFGGTYNVMTNIPGLGISYNF